MEEERKSSQNNAAHRNAKRSEEGIRCLGAGVMHGWELNPGLCKGNQALYHRTISPAP